MSRAKIHIIVTLAVLAETVLLLIFGMGGASVVEPPSATSDAELMFADHCDKSPPADFDTIVQLTAFEFGIDPRLLATTVYRESDCDAKALGSSGEIGLAQVHPDVWSKELVEAGIIRSTNDLWTPTTNLRAAAYILSQLSQAAGGDIEGTFRRYNGSGPAARKYAREQVQAFTSLWL